MEDPQGAADSDVSYYLVCFPARPISLLPETALTIGRAGDNDVVLADSEVSRRHAVVGWKGGRFFVRDLGSRNGVFVNRVRVSEAALSPDDEIRIGKRVLTFLAGDRRAMREVISRRRRDHGGVTEAIDPEEFARPAAGFAGSISEFGLGELLQVLDIARKTGRITVISESGKGEMLVKEGQVVAAACQGEQGLDKGEEAVYRMLELGSGYFEFVASSEAAEVEALGEIHEKTAKLLMEGFRRIDERKRSGGKAGAGPEETAELK